MYNWDYEIEENWRPKTKREWIWYLERKINYDDWKGLKKEMIKKYFPYLKKQLDPGKKELFENYFEKY